MITTCGRCGAPIDSPYGYCTRNAKCKRLYYAAWRDAHPGYWTGYSRRRREPVEIEQTCPCGKVFTSLRVRRYCSTNCRLGWRARADERDRIARDERKWRLWEAQERVCGLCGDPLAWEDSVLDHDHACCRTRNTRRTCGECDRGALHRNCNTILGLAGDKVETLTRAPAFAGFRPMAAYLAAGE